MRVLAALTLGLAVATGAARADEPPPDACFGDLAAGDACTTEGGAPGVCVSKTFEDAYDGTAVSTTRLVCVALVSASERRLLPWLGASLAFLALVFGLAGRRAPPTGLPRPAAE